MNYFEKSAHKYYAHCDEKLRNKAIGAGKLIDNRLKCVHSKGGITNCHFDTANYLKYFSFEALVNIGYYKFKNEKTL